MLWRGAKVDDLGIWVKGGSRDRTEKANLHCVIPEPTDGGGVGYYIDLLPKENGVSFSQINPSNRCPNRRIKLLFNLLVCEGWDFAISKPRKDVYPGQQQDTQEFVSRGPEQKEDDVDLFLRWIFHFYSTFLKDIHSS